MTRSLDNINLEYEALSYVWGESTNEHFIYIKSQRTPITDNLWQALKALRFLDEERVLWVDALCIDQSNEEERSKQVSHMYSIYTEAVSVEIWLNDSFHNVELALQFFQELTRNDLDTGILHSYVSPGLLKDDFDEHKL